jgi:hypothetical protein
MKPHGRGGVHRSSGRSAGLSAIDGSHVRPARGGVTQLSKQSGWAAYRSIASAWAVRTCRPRHHRATGTGEPSPPLLGDLLGEFDALGLQVAHGGFQVVAHEVQLVPGWTVGRVCGQLRGRELEDQPATAGVDMRLTENVSEEGAIRLRITAEHDHVAPTDHGADPTRRLDTGGLSARARLFASP